MASPQWLFGSFRLDPDNACLWHGAQAIALTPKAFDVLHYLVTHPDRLVSKDTLLDAVWPETAVSDAVVRIAIGELRRALGDTTQAPRFIATVSRRGYRFVAPVVEHTEGGPDPASPVPQDAPAVHPQAHVALSPGALASPEAERRRLTVLFCDLVDSTALAGHLDPEDLREVVRAYHQTCAAVIQPYDGYIAQYLGDGLLVYFGYPRAHEDDAQRAVRAGLGILYAIGPLNSRLPLPPRDRLAVRMGIHTGLVVVGEVGAGARQEPLALGETPNLAARLQGLAASDTLVISAATWQLLGGFFACQALGPVRLRGRAQPLEVYQVLAETTARSRLEALGSTGLTPLVGREQEVGLLRERWAQVKDGLGQVVLLSGEAGIGKSRLVQVLQEYVATEAQAWLTPCQCSPYHQNTALYPMIDLLERVVLRFDREESPRQKLSKLEGHLVQYGLPLAETVPLFAALLSLPLTADYAPLPLSPEQQKQKTLHAFLTILLHIAAQQPVLFVMEDLHWVDPVHARVAQPPGRSRPHGSYPGPAHLSSGLPPTLDGALASHADDAVTLAAAPGCRDDWSGGARQGAACRGRRADRGQDRWRTAVCGGVDQDGAGVWPAPGAGGRLCADRAAASAGDSHHAARLADGAARSPGDGEGAGATRGDAGARVCLRTAARRRPVGRGDRTTGTAPVGGGRSFVPARVAATGDVPLQARPDSGGGLSVFAEEYAAAVPSTHCAGAWRAQFPETAADAARAAGVSLHRGGSQRAGHWLLAAGWCSERSSARPTRKRFSTSPRGLQLLATLPETPARAQQELDLQIALGPALAATRGICGPGGGADLCPGAGVVRTGGRDAPALTDPVGLMAVLSWPGGIVDGAGAGGTALRTGTAWVRPDAPSGGA